MPSNVFANGREISCKSGDGTSICAFPDVCMTPPENPATPPGVPVPYPNTGMSSDCTDGSKTVQIAGKEVMLKDKSYFKKSVGDEAGCAAKKGVITSVNRGKVYFTSWSMDVKYEGENVVRHLDLTTHNHASMPTNAPPQVHTALAAMALIAECTEAAEKVKTECNPWQEKARCPEEQESRIDRALAASRATKSRLSASGLSDHAVENHPAFQASRRRVNDEYMAYTGELSKNKCRKAMRCMLMPYKDMKEVQCKHQTPEHLIEQSSVAGRANYRLRNAPCAFTEGTSWHLGDHGVMSSARRDMYQNWATQNPGQPYNTSTAANIGATVHQDSNASAGCNPICTEKQLIAGHQRMGVNPNDSLTPTQTGIADSAEHARRQEIMRLQQQQIRDRARGG